MHEIVAIIFRLINFTILIAAAVYLFKRYALSWIQEQIVGKVSEIDQLQSQVQMLDAQKKDSEQAIINQKKLYHTLYHKMEQWNKSFTIVKNQRDQEKENIMRSLQHKVVQQQNYIALSHAQKKILPVAISNARQILTDEFRSEARAHQFIGSLIKYMGEQK